MRSCARVRRMPMTVTHCNGHLSEQIAHSKTSDKFKAEYYGTQLCLHNLMLGLFNHQTVESPCYQPSSRAQHKGVSGTFRLHKAEVAAVTMVCMQLVYKTQTG